MLRQAVSFERYFKSKHGSCSGAPLEPVGRRITWTRTTRRKEQQPRERAKLNVLVAKGRAADQSNRFACSLWRVSFKRGKRGK